MKPERLQEIKSGIAMSKEFSAITRGGILEGYCMELITALEDSQAKARKTKVDAGIWQSNSLRTLKDKCLELENENERLRAKLRGQYVPGPYPCQGRPGR